MQVKKGDFVIVDVDTVEPGQKAGGQEKPKDGQSTPQELERAPDQIEKPELNIGGKTGPGYERTGNIQKGGNITSVPCFGMTDKSLNLVSPPVSTSFKYQKKDRNLLALV